MENHDGSAFWPLTTVYDLDIDSSLGRLIAPIIDIIIDVW